MSKTVFPYACDITLRWTSRKSPKGWVNTGFWEAGEAKQSGDEFQGRICEESADVTRWGKAQKSKTQG